LMAVKEAGIARFIAVGGAGSLLDAEDNRLVDSPNFPTSLKPGAKAAADFLELVMREQELDWTFFSPAIEMNRENSGTRTAKYRTGTDYPVVDHTGKSRLSVEDLAVAVVEEIDNRQFIKRRFTAAY